MDAHVILKRSYMYMYLYMTICYFPSFQLSVTTAHNFLTHCSSVYEGGGGGIKRINFCGRNHKEQKKFFFFFF